LEEVNDLLINYLAAHPELMKDVHPRRFEELVAELFRRMGYEVVRIPIWALSIDTEAIVEEIKAAAFVVKPKQKNTSYLLAG